MERRKFFKAFLALAATALIAPEVLAKLKTSPGKLYYGGIYKFINDNKNQINLDWSEGLTASELDKYLNQLIRFNGEKTIKRIMHEEFDLISFTGKPTIPKAEWTRKDNGG